VTAELGYWRVMLQGGHVGITEPRLIFWRRRRSYGFYTTRLVRAANRASAEAQAIALVRAELAEQQLDPFDVRPLSIVADEVVELADFGDALVPGGGFTFYPEGS
jgi:hypothetical protein